MKYDLVIKGATVIDGSGAPGYISDVAVLGGKIAAMGKIEADADKIIDAVGLILTPT